MHPASPDDNPAASSPANPHLQTLADALGVRVRYGSGPYDLALPVLDFLRSDLYRTVPGDVAYARGLDALREAVARADALAAGLDEKGKLYLSFADDEARSFHLFREWALDGQPRADWQDAALARAFVRFLAREVRAAARMRDIYSAGASLVDGNPAAFPSVRVVDAVAEGKSEPLVAHPAARFLSVYSVEVRDGGPEEGGWTWTRKTLRATFALPGEVDDFCVDALAVSSPATLALARDAADRMGLTLPGSRIPTRDGGDREARPAYSAAPEVDAELSLEPFPGSETCTAPEPWE
jgi:hypothetical protein